MVETIKPIRSTIFLGMQEGRSRSLHLIIWTEVFKSKEQGDAGLVLLELFNRTILAKLLWRLGNEESNMGNDCQRKCFKNSRRWDSSPNNMNPFSPIWRNIIKTAGFVRISICFNLRNGKLSDFGRILGASMNLSRKSSKISELAGWKVHVLIFCAGVELMLTGVFNFEQISLRLKQMTTRKCWIQFWIFSCPLGLCSLLYLDKKKHTIIFLLDSFLYYSLANS